MSSIMKEIADAVAADLTAATLSLSFAATVRYVPQTTVPDLASLSVTVAPNSQEARIFTRGAMAYESTVTIGVEKQIDGTGEGDYAALDQVTDEIVEHLAMGSYALTGSRKALFKVVVREPYSVIESFTDSRVYRAFIQVTYEVRR